MGHNDNDDKSVDKPVLNSPRLQREISNKSLNRMTTADTALTQPLNVMGGKFAFGV